MGAFAGLEILHHLVANLKALELDDADELTALFPNLALAKFKGHRVGSFY